MDNGNAPVERENSRSRQIAPWTPEDASRFLTSAIQEAQRPLTDALRQRSVPPGIFAVVMALIVAAAAAVSWVLLDRLDKAEQAADGARAAKDQAVVQRNEIESKRIAAEVRLKSTENDRDRILGEWSLELNRLRAETDGLRTDTEELKRLRQEVTRHRRQNELLRSQISGLEMETQALSRQLSATRALAIADVDDEPEGEAAFIVEIPPVTPSETDSVVPNSPAVKAPEKGSESDGVISEDTSEPTSREGIESNAGAEWTGSGNTPQNGETEESMPRG